MTLCESCSAEIDDDDEVQQCELCDVDGLGNCCVNPLDHPCIGPKKGTRVRCDFDLPGGRVTGMEGDFIMAKDGEAHVETHLGTVVGPLETVEIVDRPHGT